MLCVVVAGSSIEGRTAEDPAGAVTSAEVCDPRDTGAVKSAVGIPGAASSSLEVVELRSSSLDSTLVILLRFKGGEASGGSSSDPGLRLRFPLPAITRDGGAVSS